MKNYTVEDLGQNKYVILSPFRAGRPDDYKNKVQKCPLCEDDFSGAKLRTYSLNNHKLSPISVYENLYPFTDPHEVIALSAEHDGSFSSFNIDQIEFIFSVYRDRYNLHWKNGQPLIFHNFGPLSGQSLKHPHSQIAIFDNNIKLKMLKVSSLDLEDSSLNYFYNSMQVLTPTCSQYSYESWIIPVRRGQVFGQMSDFEINDLAKLFKAIVILLESKFGADFSYNFVVYPGVDWYLRIIPRLNTAGILDLALNITVNSTDPLEPMLYYKKHLTKMLEKN